MSALSILPLVAGIAHGATPLDPAALHSLVTDIEALCQQKRDGPACDALIEMTSKASGLARDDQVHLRFVAAMRALDGGNEPDAVEEIKRALSLDPFAALPPHASRLGTLLNGAPPDEIKNDAGRKKPELKARLEAVDTLYKQKLLDGADVALDLAHVADPLSPSELAQVALRRGISKVGRDPEGAIWAFQDALILDPGVTLPSDSSGKVIAAFNCAKRRIPVPVPPPPSNPPPEPKPQDPGPFRLPSTEALIAGGGGLALIAGGVAAGVVALRARQDAQERSETSDIIGYRQSCGRVRTAALVADGSYAAGAAALGVGIFLYMRFPGETRVTAGAAPGKASVTVGGHF